MAPPVIYEPRDKPQGFEEGKAKKRGIHLCAYYCGKSFGSKRKAKEHSLNSPCPARNECDARIAKMWALWGSEEEQRRRYSLEELLKSLPVQNPEERTEMFILTTEFRKGIF